MSKISAHCIGDINSASSRLRSYYLFDPENTGDIVIYRNAKGIKSIYCDILHLQKCYQPIHFLNAIIFRLLGKTVIFDIDDQAVKLKHRFAIIVMLKISNTVTTDTEERKIYLSKYIDKNKIHVLHDIVDISPRMDINSYIVPQRNIENIAWIGHRDNFESICKIINSKLVNSKFGIIVVTNITQDNKLVKEYPSIKFINWSIDIMLGTEVDAKYVVLSHNATCDKNAVYKSENKMVLSIASGFIPIVSRSPSYSRLAKKINAECLLFDNISDIPNIIRSLTVKWEKDFFNRSKRYIVNNYSQKAVFSEFKSLVRCKTSI